MTSRFDGRLSALSHGTGTIVVAITADAAGQTIRQYQASGVVRGDSNRDLFEIGSVSKTFTALMLADMTQSGHAALTEGIATYIPSLRGTPAGRVTLLQLATHTSGFPRLPPSLTESEASVDESNPYGDYHDPALVKDVLALRLPEGPAAYRYSNFGFGFLGYVLGKIANTSYEDALRTHLLQPLGMNDTCVSVPSAANRTVVGHGEDGSAVPFWSHPSLGGSGGINSTPGDLARFLDALIDPSSTIAANFAIARQPRAVVNSTTSIGLGWMTSLDEDIEVVWHNGGTGGFSAFLGVVPNEGVGVCVLTNRRHYPALDNAALYCLRVLAGAKHHG